VVLRSGELAQVQVRVARGDSLTVRATVSVQTRTSRIAAADLPSFLRHAAEEGDPEWVAECLARGATPNALLDPAMRERALHKACAAPAERVAAAGEARGRGGHAEVVRLLLDSGASANATNAYGETPLLLAATYGRYHAAAELLRGGKADLAKRSDSGWSPMNSAAKNGHLGMLKLLMDAGAPLEEPDEAASALLKAAEQGHAAAVRALLTAGAEPGVRDGNGDTALAKLVEKDEIDVAVEIVEQHRLQALLERCSRDRKKAQRAKMLVRLRQRQRQKEGVLPGTQTTPALALRMKTQREAGGFGGTSGLNGLGGLGGLGGGAGGGEDAMGGCEGGDGEGGGGGYHLEEKHGGGMQGDEADGGGGLGSSERADLIEAAQGLAAAALERAEEAAKLLEEEMALEEEKKQAEEKQKAKRAEKKKKVRACREQGCRGLGYAEVYCGVLRCTPALVHSALVHSAPSGRLLRQQSLAPLASDCVLGPAYA
jgi:hypothetical protein